MKIIDHWITTKELNPPIGQTYFYAAKVQITAKVDGEVEHLGQNLGERCGKTKSEAIKKMESAYQAWLTSVSGNQ